MWIRGPVGFGYTGFVPLFAMFIAFLLRPSAQAHAAQASEVTRMAFRTTAPSNVTVPFSVAIVNPPRIRSPLRSMIIITT